MFRLLSRKGAKGRASHHGIAVQCVGEVQALCGVEDVIPDPAAEHVDAAEEEKFGLRTMVSRAWHGAALARPKPLTSSGGRGASLQHPDCSQGLQLMVGDA